jgi:alkyldihydroxyacetonephosphate synthase
MNGPGLHWWGWGTADKIPSLKDRSQLWPTLQAWLDLPERREERAPVLLDQIELRPPQMDDPVLTSLYRVLRDDAICTDSQARIEHACGKSYRDLIRLRRGKVSSPPDVVVYPADEGQVAGVLAWAADRDIVVVPFGGGTSTVGGVEPPPGGRPTITMDLTRMNRLVSLNTTSWTARVQAGIKGPDLEAALNKEGFTLGHYPQSFEFSTLGGWIATRSAGQAASGYGTIADMTQALRSVSPTGILETRNAPATATGPCLHQVLLGSEGRYGVVTEAVMRVRPQPEIQDYRGIAFHRLENAMGALQELTQRGPRPTLVSLADRAETAAAAVLSNDSHGLRWLADRGMEAYLSRRGHNLNGESCLLILGYDGEANDVKAHWKHALTVCRDFDGTHLGQASGDSWKRERFVWPYLRDILINMNLVVDTFETATTWSNLINLYQVSHAALKAALPIVDGGPGYVMTRFSHFSPWGASLSTTFLGRQAPGYEIEQWQEIKQAATEAILDAGGTLSHHHGIGRDHARWLEEEIGPVGVTVLDALKHTLDPQGIMNPGDNRFYSA